MFVWNKVLKGGRSSLLELVLYRLSILVLMYLSITYIAGYVFMLCAGLCLLLVHNLVTNILPWQSVLTNEDILQLSKDNDVESLKFLFNKHGEKYITKYLYGLANAASCAHESGRFDIRDLILSKIVPYLIRDSEKMSVYYIYAAIHSDQDLLELIFTSLGVQPGQYGISIISELYIHRFFSKAYRLNSYNIVKWMMDQYFEIITEGRDFGQMRWLLECTSNGQNRAYASAAALFSDERVRTSFPEYFQTIANKINVEMGGYDREELSQDRLFGLYSIYSFGDTKVTDSSSAIEDFITGSHNANFLAVARFADMPGVYDAYTEEQQQNLNSIVRRRLNTEDTYQYLYTFPSAWSALREEEWSHYKQSFVQMVIVDQPMIKALRAQFCAAYGAIKLIVASTLRDIQLPVELWSRIFVSVARLQNLPSYEITANLAVMTNDKTCLKKVAAIARLHNTEDSKEVSALTFS